MPPPRLSEATKRLHGTTRKRPGVSSANAPRLTQPIAPPRDLTPEVKTQWRRHMALVCASHRMTPIDLLAFRQMCMCAHGVEVAHDQAMRDGPTEAGQNNEPKAGTAWRMWLSTMGAYERWLSVFGLTPRSRSSVSPLAASSAELHVI